MNETFTLPFNERFLLAHEACWMHFDQHDGLTDIDVAVIAKRFTTDDLDHELLVDSLCTLLFPADTQTD
jgi:hypothetical protein